MEKTLSLVIPDMHSILSEANDAQWQYLKLILARCKHKELRQGGAFEFVLNLLGIQQKSSLAAIKLQHAGFSVEERWVCVADLANMQPNRDHVSVVESQFNDLTSDEAYILERDLNTYFEEDGFKFYHLSEKDWICMLPGEMSLPTISASSIMGQNIINFIPEWRTNSSFRKYFSDAQMVLHHSHGNQLRSQAGKMEINSVWLHNAGQLPESINSIVDNVISDDHVIEAIADLSGVNFYRRFDSWEELFATKGNHILAYIVQNERLPMIKPELFEILFNQLKNRKLDQLQLVLDEANIYSITTQSLKKFWKRRFDLNGLAKV